MLSFGKPNVERLKRRRDVVRLLGALRHQEPAIRQRALEALEEIGDESVVEGLVRTLREGPDPALKVQVVTALGTIGARLRNQTVQQRIAAELASRLDPYDSLRDRALEAVIALGVPAVPPLLEALEDSWRAPLAKQALARIGQATVPSLGKALEGKHRHGAAAALAAIGGELARDALLARIDHPALSRPDWEDLAEALAVFGEVALEPLARGLQNQDPGIREAAASLLGELGDPRAVEWLIPVFLNGSRSLRETAARSLCKLGWEPGEPEQEAWFLVLTGQTERTASLGALAVAPLADSLNPGMRRISLHQSVEILERIGDENAFEALLRLLTSSLPEEVLEDGIILEHQIREALETVMKRSLGKIATEPLRNAARLRNPKVLIRPIRDGEPYYGLECREEEIDCSKIRELAQQELARRAPS
jgi:HEAT repeat protein